jgi:dolichyl-phosphate-mannose-protein mannosyltransferase
MTSRMSMQSRPLFALAATVVVAGLVLRFLDLGFPPGLSWDEHHFVENARNYMEGRADWNDHPPLGKLLIALSMQGFGDSAFAFRLPSACLGSLSVLFAFLLGRSVFRSTHAGVLAGMFVAADGFLIAYSRTALLDGMLTSVALLALWLMTVRRGIWLLLAGIVIGSGMSIKMSALVLAGPMMAIWLLGLTALTPWGQKRIGELTLFSQPIAGPKAALIYPVLALFLAATVYLLWWRLGLSISQKPATFVAALEAHQKMVEHHEKLTDWTHPLLSRWWTWFLPTKPILLRHQNVEGGLLRVMTSMGNPLLWWSVDLAVLHTLLTTLRRPLRLTSTELSSAWLLIAYVAYLSPWMVTNRDSYIYHYLPAYGIGMVLLGGLLDKYGKGSSRRATLVLGFAGAVTVVSAFYAPVWAQIPISSAALDSRPFIK